MARNHFSFRAAPLALLTLGLALQPGCARNPVTGALQLALIPEAQEIQMGQEAAAEVASSLGLVDDPELQRYVQDIGARLAAISERPHLPWTFGVIDDPTPNAFALPGGFIYVTRGMMNLMSTEAQLATVLGHEIGHVTARHHVTRISRAQLAQIGLGVGGILFPQLEALGGLAGAGLQLLFLQHSREAERQADDLGFRYALDQGFDIREMGEVFISLQRLGESEQQQSAIPSWLMTHPAPAERIQTVARQIEAVPPAASPRRIGRQPYLEQLEGLVYGANPRHGFFREGLFLHPDLRFQIGFPVSWRRQNLTQAVVAMSPDQDGALQLTLASDASPDAAAQRFLGQQGVQPGQASRLNVSGLPTVLSSFRAQTEQGVIQGLIAFIAYEGRVYQVMGFAPVAAYPRHDATFQATLRSFAPLSDPVVLTMEPDRVSIVRTTESMTLTQFNQRYPSSIPIEQLAVLNQLAGPGTIIPGGSLVKQVVAGWRR